MQGTRCFISVAGNIEPEKNITEALLALKNRVNLKEVSEFYKTPALGRPEQPDYLNGVVLCIFEGTAQSLKNDHLRAIEDRLGRTRCGDKYAARTIDLDILIFGTQAINEQGLTLPDPDIVARPFLTAGILSLDPDIQYPGKNILLRDMIDLDSLKKLTIARDFTRLIKELLGL